MTNKDDGDTHLPLYANVFVLEQLGEVLKINPPTVAIAVLFTVWQRLVNSSVCEPGTSRRATAARTA